MKMKALPLIMLLLLLNACSGVEIPPDKQEYIGQWTGGGVELWINDNGSVEYEKIEGRTSTEINAPIQDFEGDDFQVGVWLFSTTFDVQTPPHQDNGTWKMVVDGVELTRAP